MQTFQTRIKQTNDHTPIKHGIEFRSSFESLYRKQNSRDAKSS